MSLLPSVLSLYIIVWILLYRCYFLAGVFLFFFHTETTSEVMMVSNSLDLNLDNTLYAH